MRQQLVSSTGRTGSPGVEEDQCKATYRPGSVQYRDLYIQIEHSAVENDPNRESNWYSCQRRVFAEVKLTKVL
jgi:hypothetical protein